MIDSTEFRTEKGGLVTIRLDRISAVDVVPDHLGHSTVGYDGLVFWVKESVADAVCELWKDWLKTQ